MLSGKPDKLEAYPTLNQHPASALRLINNTSLSPGRAGYSRVCAAERNTPLWSEIVFHD